MVSDMVVELVTRNGESRFHFNGTVEWALDSVESDEVVWLPREDQLRELLGDYFLSLDSSSGGYVVTVSGPGRAYHTEPEADAADAYARAPLYVSAPSGRLSPARRPAGQIGPGQHRRSVRKRPGAARASRRPPTPRPARLPSSSAQTSSVQECAAAGGTDQRSETHVAEAEAAAGDQPDEQIEQTAGAGAGRRRGAGAASRRPAQRQQRPPRPPSPPRRAGQRQRQPGRPGVDGGQQHPTVPSTPHSGRCGGRSARTAGADGGQQRTAEDEPGGQFAVARLARPSAGREGGPARSGEQRGEQPRAVVDRGRGPETPVTGRSYAATPSSGPRSGPASRLRPPRARDEELGRASRAAARGSSRAVRQTRQPGGRSRPTEPAGRRGTVPPGRPGAAASQREQPAGGAPG